MGLSTSVIFDPLDLGGGRAAASSVATAETNAQLLRTFFDQSQQNLDPFLDVANRTLPGLEQSATPEGFFGDIDALRPIVSQITQPIVQDGLRDFNSELGAAGQTRSGFAATGAADIQEDADLNLLLQLQSMLTGRRQQVAGFGTGTGKVLSQLGQSSGEQVANVRGAGIRGGAAATAAGQQNVLDLAGLGAEFFNTPSSSGNRLSSSGNSPSIQSMIDVGL